MIRHIRSIRSHILHLTILVGLFSMAGTTEAAVTNWSEESNTFPTVTSYEFEVSADCSNTLLDTHLEGKSHYIFVPSDVTQVNTVMLYLHGDGSYTFDDFCRGGSDQKTGGRVLGACHAITENQHTAIVALQRPSAVGNQSGPWFRNAEASDGSCLLATVGQAINQAGIPASAGLVYGGWSGGGTAIQNLIPFLPPSAVAIFDGCYGSWCNAIADSPNALQIFYYYDDGYDEDDKSRAAIARAPNKSTGYLLNHGSHYEVPALCALDMLTDGDPCYGLATRDSGAGSDGANGAASVGSGSGGGGLNITIHPPSLEVAIPGVTFSQPTADQLIRETIDGTKYLQIPFLGEYIAGIYRYAVGLITILASVVLIGAGIMYMTSGAANTSSKAKELIVGAVTALGLAISSYLILFVVSPELVRLRTIEVKLIDGRGLFDHGLEGDDEGLTSCPWGAPGTIPQNFTRELDSCLYEHYLQGITIGEQVPSHYIENPMGIQGKRARILNHPAAIAAWTAAFNEIEHSTDPEIVGLRRWMQDFANGSAPDLSGEMDGQGVVSALFTRVCYNKNNQPVSSFAYSMHTSGFALDIMTRSNWDVQTPESTSSRGSAIARYCSGLDRARSDSAAGLYTNATYNLGRVNDALNACISDPNSAIPWTTFPEAFIRAFERQGIYWGGYGWGDAHRSDAMHFEFYGECCHLASHCRNTVGARFPQFAS